MPRTVDILHIADEPDSAERAADYLESENEQFTVETATSNSDGLAKLTEKSFDCIASDYDLPGQNGIELVRTVREEFPNLPFILYTDNGSEVVASEAISAGVTDYLQKESDTSQYALLANRIENAVEHRRTHQQRQQSERRFDAIFEDPQMLVGILDPDGTLRKANQTAVEYIDADHDAVTGDLFWDTPWWSEDVRPDVQQWVERAADGEYVGYETDLVDAEHTQYRVEGSIRPVTSTSGEIISLIASAEDITEQKEYEQELERYEAYLEHAAEAITVLDTDGRIQYESPAVETILGYEPMERAGELALDYVYPDDRADLIAQFERSVAEPGATEEAEFRARHKNGSWQWLESRAAYHPEPPIEGVVASSRDITDRKQREQELTRYEETLDTLPDSVSIFDSNLDCIYVNQTLVDESGIPHDQYLEKSIETLLEPLPDAEAQEWIESMEKLVAGEQTHVRKTVAIPTDTGTRHLDTRAGRIESESGELLGVVNVLRDVTERVEDQQEIQHQNEQLKNFADFVSHDLRNPLNVAAGNLELAREEGDTEHLETVADAHERMETLIDNLLTLARQGTAIEELESVDLALLTGMSWKTVETEAASLNITAEQTIRAEKSRVQELLENLFRNAVEHAGGDVTVTVGDLADGQGFYVEDDGPGIPEDKRDEVFNAGYSTADTGTGLGLELVEVVADAHDWEISVTESEHGGARFEITGVETTLNRT